MNITTCCLLPWCLWTDERLQNLTWLENVSRNLSNTGYFIPAGGSSTPKCIYRAAENMHDQLISCSVPSCADWEAWCTGGKPMWFLREPVNRIKNEVGRRSLNWSFTSQLQQHLKGHFHEDVIPKLDAFSSQKNTCFFWRIQKKPVHHL